ncbi:MAG: hypothetical protein V4592_06465 [Bacteroidota bacterium]
MEETARIKEKERIDNIVLAKKQAEQKVQKEAFDKANKERINKIYNTAKVEIALPKTKGGATKTKLEPVKLGAKSVIKKPVFFGTNRYEYFDVGHFARGNAFTDIKGDTIIKNKNWVGIRTAFDWDTIRNVDKLPPGYGIVFMKPEGSGDGGYLNNYISDIVDDKGNRVLNDDEICYVDHIAYNYFLCFKGKGTKPYHLEFSNYLTGDAFKECFFYNIATKEKVTLPMSLFYGKSLYVVEREFSSHGYEHGHLSEVMNYYIGLENWVAAIGVSLKSDTDGAGTVFYVNKAGELKSKSIVKYLYKPGYVR